MPPVPFLATAAGGKEEPFLCRRRNSWSSPPSFMYMARCHQKLEQGRYGSNFPVGEVTRIDAEDLPLLNSSLNSQSPTLKENHVEGKNELN
ncbi:hypothetical protein Ahy_A03g014154 [Arachis hypogaea]|uniref:Uncharacterized protein n=1 Tax=Arachis hypogaea TaxID=3818 RepID=A0A445DX50_ARAHY|nr:hypothetical protein Ahy_A03g014154 [Arachis hypogaea]